MTYSETAKQYCLDITSGKKLACQLVQLACQRHLDDLERQQNPDYPFRFDDKKAEKRCKFSEKFVHVKGKWTGKRINLEPWQVFIECSLFGWVRKSDGLRRFRVAYIEIPRKNGKSVLGALAGLYMLTADGEKGSEIYSGATTEKQAHEVFRPAWQMSQKSEDFRDFYGVSLSGTPRNPTSIYCIEDMSRFEPLVGHPGEGASPHCAIIDEYHEHRSSAQYDSMETGMGAREQPLMFVITTAGVDTSSPCYDMHLRAVKILEKSLIDDAFFTIIYTIDQDQDFKDFEIWKAANPNYGISINEDYLKRKYSETMTSANKQNINLCKHLNVWTNAGVAWMNMVKLAACIDPSLKLSDFAGRKCWAALDLASKIDICALVLLFERRPTAPLDDDPESELPKIDREFVAFAKYYLPEETVQLAGNEHYVKWVREGWITETPGARTDFAYIENDLKQIHKESPIIDLSFDPREAGYLINNVMQWYRPECCVEINQGPALMSQPMKELEALVYSRRLWFSGDPVLTWMIGNVVKKQGRSSGPVKYYYPTKEKDENKIDGAVSLIMAISRAMAGGSALSAYDGLTVDQMKERLGI